MTSSGRHGQCKMGKFLMKVKLVKSILKIGYQGAEERQNKVVIRLYLC